MLFLFIIIFLKVEIVIFKLKSSKQSKKIFLFVVLFSNILDNFPTIFCV